MLQPWKERTKNKIADRGIRLVDSFLNLVCNRQVFSFLAWLTDFTDKSGGFLFLVPDQFLMAPVPDHFRNFQGFPGILNGSNSSTPRNTKFPSFLSSDLMQLPPPPPAPLHMNTT